MSPFTSPFLKDSANAYMGARHLSIDTLAWTVYNTGRNPQEPPVKGKTCGS
jgi:hypothetical protein